MKKNKIMNSVEHFDEIYLLWFMSNDGTFYGHERLFLNISKSYLIACGEFAG